MVKSYTTSHISMYLLYPSQEKSISAVISASAKFYPPRCKNEMPKYTYRLKCHIEVPKRHVDDFGAKYCKIRR